MRARKKPRNAAETAGVHGAPDATIALARAGTIARERPGRKVNHGSAAARLDTTGIDPRLTAATVPRADAKNAGKLRLLFRRYRSR